MRELVDDFKRFLRDMEVNSQQFTKLTAKGLLTLSLYILHHTLCLSSPLGPVSVKSKDIQVSDIIVLDKVCLVHFSMNLHHRVLLSLGSKVIFTCYSLSLFNILCLYYRFIGNGTQ